MNKVSVVLPVAIQIALEETVGLKSEKTEWAKMAGAIGKTEAILRNKIKADDGGDEKRHHITLAEAIRLCEIDQSHKIIYALCQHFHGEFLHKPENIENVEYADILMEYTRAIKDLGTFSNDIQNALADGKITSSEMRVLRKDFLRLSVTLSHVMEKLAEKSENDKKISKRLE